MGGDAADGRGAGAATACWEVHGPLRVSADGHSLEHADGTGFVWLGDTAWYLPSLAPADARRYLTQRAARGFNVVQFVASNNGLPDSFGRRPFVGDGPPWAAAAFDEGYWGRIDAIVAGARALGLFVVLLAGWGGSADNPGGASTPQFFADPDVENERYGWALGLRYRDEPHVIWCGSGEYHAPCGLPVPKRHLARLVRLARGLRSGAGEHQLLTMHPYGGMTSGDEFHDAPWLDFNMVQTHIYQDQIPHLIGGDWGRAPAKPTLLAEGWYEAEESLHERRVGIRKAEPYDTAWVQRYQAYWATFHGSIGYSYGHRNLWQMGEATWNEGVLHLAALDAPGSGDLRHLRALLLSYPVRSRTPDQALILPNTRGGAGTLRPTLRCATRDVAGRWALAYSTRGEVIGLALDRLAAGTADAAWYNPRTGRWWSERGERADRTVALAGIPCGPGASPRYLLPPGGPADGNDWVLTLHLRATRDR